MSQPGRLVPAQSKEPRQPPCPTDLIWHFREKLRIPKIDDVLCRNIRQRQVRWSATLALSCFCSGPTTARTTHDGVEDKTFPKDTSLLAGGRQDLVRIEEFQGKIAAARCAGRECDLLVVAPYYYLYSYSQPYYYSHCGPPYSPLYPEYCTNY
jgi:hypothetical protein